MLKYNDQYEAVVKMTKAGDCCNYLKSVVQLAISNWAVANGQPGVKRPTKGNYGHIDTLTEFIPKMERYGDPAPGGKGIDMRGNLMQRIITECKLTEEQVKRVNKFKFKVPGRKLTICFRFEVPNVPVVLNPGGAQPHYRHGYEFSPDTELRWEPTWDAFFKSFLIGAAMSKGRVLGGAGAPPVFRRVPVGVQ